MLQFEVSESLVFCHGCGEKQKVDTIKCARTDTWPVCCGKYMEVEARKSYVRSDKWVNRKTKANKDR